MVHVLPTAAQAGWPPLSSQASNVPPAPRYVMDADLRHPPEALLPLLNRAQEGDVDLVLAGRFVDGGSARFGRFGRSSLACRAVPPVSASAERYAVSPIRWSGFFLVGRRRSPRT